MPATTPDIVSIYISIFDTTLPAISEENIVDFAEKGSIHLIYDGGEDKFLTMMPSRLEFDMEVSIEESLNVLVYDYLFTGNETRYNVTIHDQLDRLLWTGFLLPEEYVEPYEKATFFVHITATDGLGRLKGHKLPNSFYRARQSVIKTIADCLKKTGLELEIYMCSAVVNQLAQLQWEQIYVDAAQWNNEDKPADCYQILDAILFEIGATLFQQNSRWYIIGWNRRGSSDNFEVHRYNADGISVGYVSENIAKKNLNWYATPSVAINPPFREVSVKENLPDTIDLFPEDLIVQPWEMTSEDQDPPPVLHWKNYGAGDLKLLETSEWDFRDYDNEPFEQQANVGYVASEPSIPAVPDYPGAPVHYMSLGRPVFMKGGQYIDFDFVWDMRIYNPGDDNIDGYVNNANYYDITLNGNVIMSNRFGFPTRNTFKWKGDIVWANDYTTLTATVKVRKYWLAEDGFLDIKFICSSTSVSPAPVFKRITQLSFVYRKEIDSFFKRRRTIDFTTTKEITINNAGSVFDKMQYSFIYQPYLDPAHFQEVNFAAGYEFDPSNNNSPMGWCLFLESAAYALVFAMQDQIFVKRENSDFYEYVDDISFYNVGYTLVKITLPDGHLVREGDSLLVKFAGVAGNPQTIPVIQAREQWEKTTFSGSGGRLGEVLAEIYHDLYSRSIIKMEGTAKGLIMPLDLWQFELKGAMRNFIPIRIDITPNENQSSVSFLEYKLNKVTDYGD